MERPQEFGKEGKSSREIAIFAKETVLFRIKAHLYPRHLSFPRSWYLSRERRHLHVVPSTRTKMQARHSWKVVQGPSLSPFAFLPSFPSPPRITFCEQKVFYANELRAAASAARKKGGRFGWWPLEMELCQKSGFRKGGKEDLLLTNVLVNAVDPLNVPGHDVYGGLLSAHLAVKLEKRTRWVEFYGFFLRLLI